MKKWPLFGLVLSGLLCLPFFISKPATTVAATVMATSEKSPAGALLGAPMEDLISSGTHFGLDGINLVDASRAGNNLFVDYRVFQSDGGWDARSEAAINNVCLGEAAFPEQDSIALAAALTLSDPEENFVTPGYGDYNALKSTPVFTSEVNSSGPSFQPAAALLFLLSGPITVFAFMVEKKQ